MAATEMQRPAWPIWVLVVLALASAAVGGIGYGQSTKVTTSDTARMVGCSLQDLDAAQGNAVADPDADCKEPGQANKAWLIAGGAGLAVFGTAALVLVGTRPRPVRA